MDQSTSNEGRALRESCKDKSQRIEKTLRGGDRKEGRKEEAAEGWWAGGRGT